ncbi:hypothetical protein M899_2357 [Bacteriovorax sp. BSW11_IV]|uniref:hypothetical protein n=1 Tax=Bacteriovorax sp. BSW11_IV TaxID=1353529 RepID=UPI000389FEA1|nr:hypothetical protein [Bacteriovorax sp. BSW11_IV]EQC44607.1 hypothetical protein M899_2357 [Bacteriovorax sp. BSW11_IV]
MKSIIATLTLVTCLNVSANCRFIEASTNFEKCSLEIHKLYYGNSKICFEATTEQTINALEFINDNYFDEIEISEFTVAEDEQSIHLTYSPYAGDTKRLVIKKCD